MTNIWTIRHEPSGLIKTASEWSVDDIILNQTNQNEDIASLFLDGKAYDSDDLWDYKDEVTIFRDGTAWFRGVVISTPRSGKPNYEGVSYSLAGSWWWFENTAFLKEWASLTTSVIDGETVAGSDDQYLGYVRMFIDNNGDGISTSAALTELVNYAIAAGAPVQLGSLPTNAIVPWPSDVRDASVAQVIRQVLRWHPDVTAWFDYSTSPPTINFDGRVDAGPLTLNADGENFVQSVGIRSRDDLKPPAVCIHYEITNKVDDKQYRQIAHDIAPAGQSCNQPGAVNVTIPLRGRQITTQTESVRVTEIPDNGGEVESNDENGHKWWKRHFSVLEPFVGPTKLKIIPDVIPVRFAHEVDEDHPEEPLLKEGRKLKDPPQPSDYPNELLDGALDDWMDVHARELVVSSRIYYLGDIEDLPKDYQAQFPLFDSSSADPTLQGKYYNTAEVTIIGTDARSKNYERTVSFHEAETVPAGLAQHLYDILSNLQWEGSITLVEKEAGAQQIMGKVLNILSGHAAWQTMNAQIQKVSYDLNKGSTVITFGPAEHLAPQDLVEQLRLGKVVEFVFKEKSGEAELNTRDGKQIVGGYVQPKANSLWGPGSSDDLGRSCLTPRRFIVPSNPSEDVKLILNPCQMAAFGNDGGEPMHPIKYGTDTLDSDPPPEIPLVEGTNTIWAQWDTDENGIVENDTVEITLTEPSGRRAHIPASPEGSSQTGKYKQKCLVIEVPAPDPVEDGSTRTPTWEPVSPGLIWNVFDREMESLGDGARVASAITDDKMKFRSIKAKEETVTAGTEFVTEITVTEKPEVVEISGKTTINGVTGPLITYEDCDGQTHTSGQVTNGLVTELAGPIPVGECDTSAPGPP